MLLYYIIVYYYILISFFVAITTITYIITYVCIYNSIAYILGASEKTSIYIQFNDPNKSKAQAFKGVLGAIFMYAVVFIICLYQIFRKRSTRYVLISDRDND